jgi:hypothetical protein
VYTRHSISAHWVWWKILFFLASVKKQFPALQKTIFSG